MLNNLVVGISCSLVGAVVGATAMKSVDQKALDAKNEDIKKLANKAKMLLDRVETLESELAELAESDKAKTQGNPADEELLELKCEELVTILNDEMVESFRDFASFGNEDKEVSEKGLGELASLVERSIDAILSSKTKSEVDLAVDNHDKRVLELVQKYLYVEPDKKVEEAVDVATPNLDNPEVNPWVETGEDPN